jgi:nucleotide-binding universal stress UspA family protein
MIKKILVATDGSEHAKKAIDYACDLALKYDAEIYLLHVIHKSGVPKSLLKVIESHRIKKTPEHAILEEIGDRIIEMAQREFKEKGVKNFQPSIIEGDPAQAIIEFARDKGVDMIVLGSRGLGNLEEVFLGSVSHKVCNLAHCTCLTVK